MFMCLLIIAPENSSNCLLGLELSGANCNSATSVHLKSPVKLMNEAVDYY